MKTRGQTQKASVKEMSDNEDSRKTRGVETQGQTQKVGMPDEEAHCKKEAEKEKRARVLHDFEAEGDNELTLKTGETVVILDDGDSTL